ncbi:uncharacterized protein LOC142605352 isoform X2 [Castanea sativa]
MASSFASSSSTPKLTNEYEVFVSFRGADIRTGFISHLFAALERKTIHAFKDDINLPRGEKIGPELSKAIKASRIAVVVFSKKYATSYWCLDELVKIMECKRVFNPRVLPLFYHVCQPEVLEQKGNFADLPNGPEDKMNSWRAALTEAAKLAGLHLEPDRPESEFIEEIVENILKKLNEESFTAPSLRQNDAPGQHSSAAIPHNDASSGLDLENYSWTQTLEEVTLNVPVPTGSRSVVCEIKKNHLKVGLKGQPPIIDGELFRPVKPDDCYWSIEDQNAISILLTKHDKMEWWKSIVIGDPEINTQKVEPESSKLSDPDPETRQTVEKMMDNSSLYKNLLRELVQKEGFSLPAYDTNRSGEEHEAIFVSTVEIRKVFKGHEARTKRQAEMNAAKIAYTSLEEHMQHFYKNQLQNYAQKRNLRVPVYSCEPEGSPHASHFRCKVTVDGQTYESPEFFSTSKDAEHAAAKVALTSLVPDGAKEDNSGLYKNLLRELVQKEGFSLPAYDTNRSGEEHEAIFVSTVEIRKVFKGHEAKTKRQAEMNAAKIAYTSLNEHMQLQNYAQKRNLCVPVYSCEPESPPHASHFRCKVTVDEQTNESPEFFSTSKDAEHAVAKVALTSLVLDGAKEDNSGLYKNLLQELVQKEGFSLQAYDTNRSGEEHEAIFVSTVEIRKVFKGHEARTKRQAEMNAANIAYTSMKEHMQHFYKNQLQNYAQKRNLRVPVYSCEPEGSPNASHFRCKVTVDGQTYESPEFFSTSKDAEHAAAKVALTSLVPDGAKEDNSGLYKNLLRELVQKEGFSLPAYDTNRSGEEHEAIFVSTVEIRKVFKGHEARTKRQAEMNAAKIAYTSLKER